MNEFYVWHNEKFGDHINDTDVVRPNTKKKAVLMTIGTGSVLTAGSVVTIGTASTEMAITILSSATIAFIAVCLMTYKTMARNKKHRTSLLYNRV